MMLSADAKYSPTWLLCFLAPSQRGEVFRRADKSTQHMQRHAKLLRYGYGKRGKLAPSSRPCNGIHAQFGLSWEKRLLK